MGTNVTTGTSRRKSYGARGASQIFGERAPAIAGLSPAAGFGFRAC